MNEQVLKGLEVIVGIMGGMIGIWLFFAKGWNKLMTWVKGPGKRMKALEDQAKQFENELSEFKERHKELKHDIEILETDYKEIFKILLNRK